MTLKINGATGGSVSIDAPDNTSPAGTDVTLTLPTSAGSSGQYLQTNGSGTLSWQTVASDAITEGNTTVECVDSGSDGHITFDTEGSEAARFDSSQRLLVGTTTASGNNLLQVNSNISVNGLNFGSPGGGQINIGSNNFGSLTTGYGNVCIGANTGPDITSGYENVIVGYAQSFGGWNVTTGRDNVFYGIRAGEVVTTGALNICIGYYANPSANNGENQIVIGTYGSTGKGNNSGFINANGGGVYQGNNSSSWSTTSDRRLKKNIVDNTEGLDVINQVRVVNFEYRLPEEIEQEELQSQALVKRDENDEVTGLQGVKLGVIAQELQQVCSGCVKEESTGVLSVVDDNLFWHMVNAVKELSAQNASLEARLTALEGGAA